MPVPPASQIPCKLTRLDPNEPHADIDAVLKHVETVAIDAAEVAAICEARRAGFAHVVRKAGA